MLAVGQTVVYGTQGVCTVREISMLKLGKTKGEYYVLSLSTIRAAPFMCRRQTKAHGQAAPGADGEGGRRPYRRGRARAA